VSIDNSIMSMLRGASLPKSNTTRLAEFAASLCPILMTFFVGVGVCAPGRAGHFPIAINSSSSILFCS